MPVIISVENVSKLYHIAVRQSSDVLDTANAGSLSESLGKLFRDPFSIFKRNGHLITQELWALKDVSFEVKQGEIVGIIGRNGAGKSTLLKILSRITEPTSGRAKLYGRVGSLLEVGTGFHPELTGRENVFLNGAILGMKREEISRKFDEIVAFSEIDQFIDTPVKYYSSGMYMRLAFAIAAHLEPEVLIVDEVLAVGDLAFQKKCMGKMGGVAKEGRTVVFVSHAMEAIRKICNRGVLLEKGVIVNQGSIESVVGTYTKTGAMAQSVYEIPKPTDFDDRPGYTYRVTIEDGEGRATTSIPVGRPWQIRVDFQINRPVEHFIVAIGLSTNLNAPLRTSWAEPRDITPGKYQAIFREETIIFGTGRYSIHVGLSTNERTFHYAQDAGVVDIADFAEGVDLVRVSNHGYILNPFQIEIAKL